MSSAILYLAIVAIWACVLIPRWLRRDSAHGAVTTSSETAAPHGFVAPDGFVTPGAISGDGDSGSRPDGSSGDDSVGDTMAAEWPGDTVAAGRPGDTDDAPRPLPAPPGAEESRRHMLAARRRLLGILIILEVAAIALAFLGLAAPWVVVPPTIMLTGYLLLLREAARADAEHAQREADAAARAQAMARSRHGGRARRPAGHPTPAEGTPLAGTAAAAAAAAASASTAADLAARFAAAPVPADYEDSGRDFAPGLAGKYTTSNTDSEVTDEDPYGYEEPRLRAVGD